ncbi:hypothetical protein Tco_0852973, partial [Tanacetum coccineum]
MSTSTHPIIILSDSDVEDAFSSTNAPDYTSASSDYSPTSPGNTSSDLSEDSSKDRSASLTISPFHDDPYMKNWDGKIYCCKRIFPKVTELNSKAQLGLAYFVDKAIPLPGLTFAIYRLLMGNSDLIGDGWTSSLAE